MYYFLVHMLLSPTSTPQVCSNSLPGSGPHLNLAFCGLPWSKEVMRGEMPNLREALDRKYHEGLLGSPSISAHPEESYVRDGTRWKNGMRKRRKALLHITLNTWNLRPQYMVMTMGLNGFKKGLDGFNGYQQWQLNDSCSSIALHLNWIRVYFLRYTKKGEKKLAAYIHRGAQWVEPFKKSTKLHGTWGTGNQIP